MSSPDLWLLDTNTISHAIRGVNGVRDHVRALPQQRLRVPVVVVAELEYGSLRAPDPAQYRLRWRRFIDGIGIVPFDEAAAVTHARLRLALRHQPIGERDLLIAAIALAHGLGVATGNTAGFKRVPKLKVVDWAK
jgi:tRNA(fMet)-specific endonuclease VapC